MPTNSILHGGNSSIKSESNLNIFKLNSRLGLYVAPFGHTDRNVGVEDGPNVVLDRAFINSLKNSGIEPDIHEFGFSAPENIKKPDYFKVIHNESKDVIDQITAVLSADDRGLDMRNGKPGKWRTVFLGGDHSIGLVSVASIFNLIHPDNVKMVMIDSHVDLHQPSTTPSGNFHGMWMRPIMDRFEDEAINSLFPEKLASSDLTYIGNLAIEKEEETFIERNYIQTISHKDFNSNSRQFSEIINSQLQKKKHLHISLDVDGIDKRFAPATGMPCEEGIHIDSLLGFLSDLTDFPSISLDIVEFNPKKDVENLTLNLVRKLLEIVLL